MAIDLTIDRERERAFRPCCVLMSADESESCAHRIRRRADDRSGA
jgi:hypothetical protein